MLFSLMENSTPGPMPEESPAQQRIRELGPWFHNLRLPDGTQTAPDHDLGDFPRNQWRKIEPHVPKDLSGWRVLDIGCNAGFYAFELARRGATVTAIDHDDHYLRQAQWAAERFGLGERVRFRRMQIYHLAHSEERYDLVWFMGVFYHLRYPLLGLDIAARKTGRLMVFQTMTVLEPEAPKHADPPPADMPLKERGRIREPGWPKLAFIERRLENDPTNWWAPNQTCAEALLRSCGLHTRAQPAPEIHVCEPGEARDEGIGPLLADEYRAATGQTRPDETV